MNALQQSTVGFALLVLSTLLLHAITLSTTFRIEEHLNHPDHVTLILDRIQTLSDVVEKLYQEVKAEPLGVNNPIPPVSTPRTSLEQLAKFIVTYGLMITWMGGLYLFWDGLESVRSHALKVSLLGSMLLTANLGLIVMLLFLPVSAWHSYVSGTIVAGGLGLFYVVFFTSATDDL